MLDYQKKFFDEVAPVIVELTYENDYKFPSAIIAQFICESNWNRSTLSSKYNNFGGYKAGKDWKGKTVKLKTKEFLNGKYVEVYADFIHADSVRQGVQEYFNFIGRYSRYKNLKTATSPEEYIKFLKQDGYATSPTYVETLTNILNKNNLKSYDKGQAQVVVNTKDKTPVKNAIKYLQQELNNFGGYNLAVDGIIGKKTLEAIEKFNKA